MIIIIIIIIIIISHPRCIFTSNKKWTQSYDNGGMEKNQSLNLSRKSSSKVFPMSLHLTNLGPFQNLTSARNASYQSLVWCELGGTNGRYRVALARTDLTVLITVYTTN